MAFKRPKDPFTAFEMFQHLWCLKKTSQISAVFVQRLILDTDRPIYPILAQLCS